MRQLQQLAKRVHAPPASSSQTLNPRYGGSTHLYDSRIRAQPGPGAGSNVVGALKVEDVELGQRAATEELHAKLDAVLAAVQGSPDASRNL